jgi:superfamily I DNA and/or RNA helicase
MVSQTNSAEACLVQSMANELPPGCGSTPSLIFHGSRGRCCRDSDSPSWYNPIEVNQVYSYIRKLLSKSVKAWEIGVITFYAKQVNYQTPPNFENNAHVIAVRQNEGTVEIQ